MDTNEWLTQGLLEKTYYAFQYHMQSKFLENIELPPLMHSYHVNDSLLPEK